MRDLRQRFDRLLDAASRLRLYTDEPVMCVDDDAGRVEFLVHEIGHAPSLGLPIERGVDALIARRLVVEGAVAAKLNEGLVLAAEAVVLPALGLVSSPTGFTSLEDMRSSLVDAGHIQGLEADEVVRHFDSDPARELGAKILEALVRLEQGATT